MTQDRIAIVGIALTYPDATTPGELWENVLAGRRAFRDIPSERTSLQDYWDADPTAVDQFYSRKAAVLRDYEFDRIAHRVSAGTFRVTDMTHWLALDVVGRAFADAGFPDAARLPRARTGVVIGNTLTGEFSRSHLMRLRWPYVRRTVAAQLVDRGWSAQDVDAFVVDLERQYKEPFPAPTEDTLAGGLANTIAGRVCNYFDLGGGGYIVDGACSSSLLSVANAATALTDGMLDVAVAGGVDLSIDPFELVGFARTGALATGEMRVYDEGSNGFWPGEGCGMVVLMRESDARSQGRRVYACLSGWGISSDGKGGITRPEVAGHRRAIDQAYERAGYSPETVGYFEGHGTGTAVGDETEIRALASTRGSGDGMAAALGSIKANIGHTKAAAGVAGLIKAALAVHHRTIPPITGHVDPHPALIRAAGRLFAPHEALPWPVGVPVRAGVSAMGFGGINTHIALEQADVTETARPVPDENVVAMVRGRQKGEAFLLTAEDPADLVRRVSLVRDRLTGAAMYELTDIAAAACASGPRDGVFRAALTAVSVEEAVVKLDRILDRLVTGDEELDGIERIAAGCYVGHKRHEPRIGFVFPGQGAGDGRRGALIERFGGRAVGPIPGGGEQAPDDTSGTEALQPRVVARSLDVLDLLGNCGVTARAAAGHSLGEITALAWAGAITADQAVEIATERGVCMGRMGVAGGVMAAMGTGPAETARLIDGTSVRITGYNAPDTTVIGGPAVAVDAVSVAAARSGVNVTRLNVDHAFHTEDFRAASLALRDRLTGQAFEPPVRRVLSTSTGRELGAGTNLAQHLADQMIRPVRFTDAVAQMADLDLVIEVGPGRVLSGMVAATLPRCVVTGTDSDHPDIMPFLDSLAAAHTAGCEVRAEVLGIGRVIRPFDLSREADFLKNPSEAVPRLGFTPTQATVADVRAVPEDSDPRADGADASGTDEDTLGVLRRLISAQVELPLDLVAPDTRPLDELHMSSITVGQVVNDVVRALGRPPLGGVPSFATASVSEIAVMLDEAHESHDGEREATAEVPGAMPWVRPFTVADVAVELPVTSSLGQSAGTGRSTWTPIGARVATEEVVTALTTLDGPDGLIADVRAASDQEVLDTVRGLLSDVGTAIRAGRAIRVAVLQGRRRGMAGLVKSLHLEHPDVPVTLVTMPDVGGPDLSAAVAAEVERNVAFVEVRYDAEGRRTVPRLQAVEELPQDVPLRAGDVLLATGGAKGITAEACLEIGRRFGVAVAFVGRASADSPAVAATRLRFERAEVPHHYVSADVLEPDQLARAVSRIEDELGPVTAVLHGAGINHPKAALELDPSDVAEAVGPKVTGLRNVLDAVDISRVRLVVGFASIIGRAGLFGEAHYALANAWLTEELEDLANRYPRVRVRSLEWSVWAGAGMGERLGVIERLKQQGIEPIGTADGLDELLTAVSTPGYPVTSVICSRTGSLPTLTFAPRELPLSRYLERVLVHYPGVELVSEADLGVSTDYYLPDHLLGDDLLLPAVLGMEAMAQVASGLVGSDQPITLTDVRFERPIIVPQDATETVRICAVVSRAGDVRLVVRTGSTDFAVDHFSATVRFGTQADPKEFVAALADAGDLPDIRMDPQTELYGDTMFQGPRFQRITGYQRAAARGATVGIGPNGRDDWFAPHLPSELVLGTPGIRDALMHALQCCVPDATLLPHGVDRIEITTTARPGPLVMRAEERAGDGEWFLYDLVLRDKTGNVVETWQGLRIRAVSRRASSDITWTPTLLGPYLERRAEQLLDGTRALVVEPHGGSRVGSVAERRETTALAARRARDGEIEVTYRSDGKPECSDGSQLSAAHCEGLTFVALSDGATAVDAERVRHRSVSVWRDLLGERAFATARQLADGDWGDLDSAATRVWGALECLRKIGWIDPTVHLGSVHDDGWVRFTAGDNRIATWVGRTQHGPALAMAILNGV